MAARTAMVDAPRRSLDERLRDLTDADLAALRGRHPDRRLPDHGFDNGFDNSFDNNWNGAARTPSERS